MVPRSGLQHAAVTSYAYKLQCLRIQVKQICRERDKARLDLEKAERRCLQLGRELDEQYVALEHSQSKLKDVQTEMEAKELLLQQAVNHQAKLEADTQFLQGKEASLHGRLNLMMKENTQLQNKVTEMTEKLVASEKLVLELQKELNLVVKDKLEQVEPRSPELLTQSERFAEIVLEYERQCQVLWDQNGVLRRELEALRLQLQQDSRAERGLPAAETSLTAEQLQEQLQDLKVQLETKVNYYEKEIELMRKNFEREKKGSKKSFKAEMSKVEGQKRDLEEKVAKYEAVIDGLKAQKCVQSLELEEELEMEQARVGTQLPKDVHHPRQQLHQEGEELRMQCRDREGLRKHVSKLGREEVQELTEIPEVMELSEKSKREASQLNTKLSQLSRELPKQEASRSAGPATTQLQSQRLVEAEQLQGAQMAVRPEHHGQHAMCWTEMELLRQQLRASQEKLLEAKASLSLAQTRHALQLQQAKAQMNNMVPKKQFEQLQASLREEQCRAQRLQENLHRQAEQAHRQLARTQEEHERLLQAAMEQAEGLERELRSAEAMLADRAAHLKDAQAQLSRNKLLIEDLRKENRGFAMALQAAELKQKSTEEKNQVLEEQASALKQLIGKITPASLSV
ncbi:ninein-like protein isoform X2 [Oxyura jamaicensis]|uniref:ninein-like protein isoform X2 n=1 Tax=Oxyura jamaicensis TaxID=8884 RepID=UPI0015A522B6|nr:ninein-like protein isoform X2 [Oxyura jamaicensis]